MIVGCGIQKSADKIAQANFIFEKRKLISEKMVLENEMVCLYFKFGYCKNQQACRKVHLSETCSNNNCETRKCMKRHPKTCWYYAVHGRCKFGTYCQFKHNSFPNHTHVDYEEKIASLEFKLAEMESKLNEKVNMVEDRVKCLDDEVSKLPSRISNVKSTVDNATNNIESLNKSTEILKLRSEVQDEEFTIYAEAVEKLEEKMLQVEEKIHLTQESASIRTSFLPTPPPSCRKKPNR